MIEPTGKRLDSLDLIWLVFLAGLAALPPLWEFHKDVILVAFGIMQYAEHETLTRSPRWGRYYAVGMKLILATLLVGHTGGPGINSSYYPVYYIPIVTAAVYFNVLATLLWTLLGSALYCSFLIPALKDYQLTPQAMTELATRILFFFLAGLIVNRFAIENRRQTERYRKLAEELRETNRRLERVQAEARRSERLAALGQLTAGLAHEMRNPLGVIKGSAEMLHQKLGTSNPLATELAGYITSEVNRLSALVSRFLDFARPLHAERSPHNLAALLDRALKAVASQWRGAPIQVERHYEEDLPLAAVDEELCQQALINLVGNAYEAMGERGGTLRVEARRHSTGKIVEVRIQDSGPGIPPELREQIFNPFVTTKKTGVGLGLSIVSKIVDEHGGSIHVDSAPGQGASFVLYFPVQPVAVETQDAVVTP